MTLKGAIADLQNLIDSDGIPFWAKPSLQKVKETIELEIEERKTGKWILLDECSNSGYYCSSCQKKLVKEGWSNTVKKIKFCPNCGAKMEDSNDKI